MWIRPGRGRHMGGAWSRGRRGQKGRAIGMPGAGHQMELHKKHVSRLD